MANVFPQNGRTSLHAASLQCHPAIVQLLIESGAKLEIKNNVSVEVLVVYMGKGS